MRYTGYLLPGEDGKILAPDRVRTLALLSARLTHYQLGHSDWNICILKSSDKEIWQNSEQNATDGDFTPLHK